MPTVINLNLEEPYTSKVAEMLVYILNFEGVICEAGPLHLISMSLHIKPSKYTIEYQIVPYRNIVYSIIPEFFKLEEKFNLLKPETLIDAHYKAYKRIKGSEETSQEIPEKMLKHASSTI